jgi:hypothetical protein
MGGQGYLMAKIVGVTMIKGIIAVGVREYP